MLCTSGFLDDIIFAHKPRLLDVAAQLKRSAHAALGLAINKLYAVKPVVGHRAHDTTFRVLEVASQVATPGAKSAVYDCLIFQYFLTLIHHDLPINYFLNNSVNVNRFQYSEVQNRLYTKLHAIDDGTLSTLSLIHI